MPRYNEPTHRAAKIAYTFVVCTATHPEGDASTDARCRGEHHADDAEPKGVDGLRRRPKARHAGDGQEWRRIINDDEPCLGGAASACVHGPHTSSYGVRRTKVEGSHQFGSLLRLGVNKFAIKEREHRFVPSLQSREKKTALANAQNNKINRSKSKKFIHAKGR